MLRLFRQFAIAMFAIVVCSSTYFSQVNSTDAKPFLHPLFTDNMVLQRDIRFPVWGWTEPGKTVTVELQGKKATATADAQGRWQVQLGPYPAGGPYTMSITGPQ